MNVKTLAIRTLVSLDQCYLSRLAIKDKRDSDFENLLHTLLEAVNAKRIVCPSHELETKYESIKMKDAESARKVIKLQNRLSLGYAFNHFLDLVAWKMLQTVRPSFDFQKYNYRRIQLDCNKLLELRKARLEKMDAERKTTVAQMPYPPTGYTKGTPVEEICAEVVRKREESMSSVLKWIANTGRVSDSNGLVDWTIGVGKSLLQKSVTPDECAALLRTIEDGRWRQIDVLRVNSILFAKIEQGMLDSGRKWQLSDHADIYRLCVSFLYADVATCDSPMRDVVKQTKLESEFPVKIFAITEPKELSKHIQERCST
jgi:hypothetical protein